MITDYPHRTITQVIGKKQPFFITGINNVNLATYRTTMFMVVYYGLGHFQVARGNLDTLKLYLFLGQNYRL